MSNIIDKIQVSGVTYQIQGSGGGKAIEAGRGISVTTGETADTVSFDLPISAATNGSILIGVSCSANRDKSFVGGQGSVGQGEGSFAFGEYCKAGQWSIAVGSRVEANIMPSTAAFGKYNKQNGGYFEPESATTLFSVGNGTSTSARHNAFEVRQNGDIYLSSGGTDIKLQDHLGGGGSVTVDTELDSGSTNPVQNKVIYNKIDEVEEVTAAGLNALNSKITPTVELTQAQYDALVDKDPNTYYIITDAQAGDLTQYWTSAQTNSAITQATSGKQETLVSGTNIKTINNESILGSGNIDIQGGSTYTAGRGISIANDTISFNLPISAGTGTASIVEGGNSTRATGNQSHAEGFSTSATSQGAHSEGIYSKASGIAAHAEGNSTTASGVYSHAEGQSTTASSQASHTEGMVTTASGNYSHAEGYYTNATNESEHASGKYNVSRKASTTFGDSGNTLFSVGNGTADNARHNAFEIRQNGDIYLTKDGQDVKLQDQLGGSSITVDTALDSGSTNPVENRVIYNKIDEVEQVTAASLNALNDNFGGLKLVKLSQAEYNALATKDSSTLYIIVN